MTTEVDKERKRGCELRGLPEAPEQSSLGGDLRLQLSSANARCVDGIEARNKWIQIKFFNGRELDLAVNANSSAKSREGTIVFAGLRNSEQLHLQQAGITSTRYGK